MSGGHKKSEPDRNSAVLTFIVYTNKQADEADRSFKLYKQDKIRYKIISLRPYAIA